MQIYTYTYKMQNKAYEQFTLTFPGTETDCRWAVLLVLLVEFPGCHSLHHTRSDPLVLVAPIMRTARTPPRHS